MKTHITLVRHGVTDWNYDGRAQGHSDIPLNSEGRRQAEAVASRLASELWDAIYSSDLARAISTAQAVCRRTGHELNTEPLLRERNIGLAEGTIESERQFRWPGVPWNSLPGLETNEQLARRGVEILTQVARRHPGQRVIVVSHGGLIAAFLRDISAGSGHVGIPRNTGMTSVLYDGHSFTQSSSHDFRHLMLDGIEYTGEKGRLVFEGTRSGLPGIRLALNEVEPFIGNATAVESAWVDGRLVGYARVFSDRVRYGYIDFIHTLPEYQRVRPILLSRLEQRFPTVTFAVLNDGMAERSGA